MTRRLQVIEPLEERAGRWAGLVRALLGAVDALPWATTTQLARYAGVAEWRIRQRALPLARALGLIETARVPAAGGKAPLRVALTPRGAEELHVDWERAAVQDALLRSRQLDVARRVLLESAEAILWGRSPYTVPASAVRRARAEPARPGWVDLARRSVKIPLDVLAAVRADGGVRHVAVLVDPGDLDLALASRLIRSWAAWRARPEWRGCPRGFPLLIWIAANPARRSALLRLWRQGAPGPAAPLRLGLIDALAAIVSRPTAETNPTATVTWIDERGQPGPLLRPTPGLTLPTAPPAAAASGWWGGVDEAPPENAPEGRSPEQCSPDRGSPERRSPDRRGLLAVLARRTADPTPTIRGLVSVHLTLSARARWLLEAIAGFPLLSRAQLGVVLGLPASQISVDGGALARSGLIAPEPDGPGWHLAWRGVAYLAAQVGMSAASYAEARHWPLAADARGWQLSLAAFMVRRAHTQAVIQFLVGLRRHGPRNGLEVPVWEFTQAPVQSGVGPGLRRLVPDGAGRVRWRGVERAVWLEIDRGTVQGRALTRKLLRYYLVDGPGPGRLGHGTRILIVTSSEGRLRSLQRRLRALDARYRTTLDVRLARLDQLQEGRDRLDPLRPVWRTADSSAFGEAFGDPEP